MPHTWTLDGEPALWLGSGYEAWKARVAGSVTLAEAAPVAGLMLDFRVASLLRNGQRFDLDNLVTPVFEAALGPRRSALRRGLGWWFASRRVDPRPGLTVSAASAPPAPGSDAPWPLVLDARVPGVLPADSREGGMHFVTAIEAALDGFAPATTDLFALELAFGPEVEDISWVAERPIKPVVDCLFPLFGGRGGAPDDWKVQRLLVRRDEPELRGACAVRAWRLDEVPDELRRLSSGGATRPAAANPPGPAASATPAIAAAMGAPNPQPRNSYEYLDEVARQLGSPPRELAIGEILSALRSRFPEMAGKSNDSLSASMDFQTINVSGRANAPGDFRRADRWNRFPAFLKTGRGVYRRLSEHERAEFLRRWAGGDPLLQRESFDAADWDRLLR